MKVIELTGFMGSGKSYIASQLTHEALTVEGLTVLRTSFAGDLKLVTRKYFMVYKNGSQAIQVPSFDVMWARLLVDLPEFEAVSEDHLYTLQSLIDMYHASPNINERITLARKINQWFGTECARDDVRQTYWLERVRNRLRDVKNLISLVIIDDYRFPQEDLVQVFKYETDIDVHRIRVDATLEVRTKRLGYVPNAAHGSESAILSLPVDEVIENNG